MAQTKHVDSPSGIFAASGAYFIWGLAPIFWKQLVGIPAYELLAHRIIWALILLMIILTLRGRWKILLAAFRDRKVLLTIGLSTLIIASNWFLYMYAILSGRILETSLGYYINPLISIILGMVFLGERMRRGQAVAVVLGALGVGWLAIQGQGFPLLAVSLAMTFGFYGLLRKLAPVGALTALTMETLFLCIPALIFLVWVERAGNGHFVAAAGSTQILIMGTGVITAIPLLLFGIGVQRISLMTLGFLQYTAPTIAFLLGVFFYGEVFTPAYKVAFCFIWSALIIYTVEGVRQKARIAKSKGDL